MNNDDRDQDRLDQALRARYAEAVSQVSGATMAQLHRRRHAALADAPARGSRWRLPAAAFASLMVVAGALGIGLHLSGDAPPAAVESPVAVAADATGIEGALDELDQNPDFYVWLASGDADLLAME
ncbi:hypothetical protein FZO89_18070 [Luteimonas viscosa]|uniref:Uncharacterized protein n=1 Tax=Luteimonas viscosa TaxID=1132694 RepID=A0A5D4XGS7_9GAMM|nr:hypothetical protein [Luteimonas viscosa]TYT23145.1 hypothetical protein FZO89_18070 [Luteimonas viscosa]